MYDMPNYVMKVTPVEGSRGKRFFWELRFYGKVVAQGVEDTEKEAEMKMGEALFSKTKGAGEKRKAKSAARLALQSLLERRPYCAMGVAELMLNGFKRGEVLREAQTSEEAWWKKHPPEERKRIPSKPDGSPRRGPPQMEAREAATKFMDLFVTLEMVVEEEGGKMKPAKKLSTWADNVFGEGWLRRKSFGTKDLLAEFMGEKRAAELMKAHGRVS